MVSDMEIQLKETIRLKSILNNIMANHTGQDIKKLEADMDRDYFMSQRKREITG